MPNYKGHLAGGCVAFAAVLIIVNRYYHPSVFTGIEWLFATLAGSLFPDIDIKSKGQKYFSWLFLGLLIYFAWQKRTDLIITLSFCMLLPLLAKHRGLFHRLWFIIIAPLTLWFFVAMNYPQFKTALLLDMIFFIAGAISHLWLDVGLKRMLLRW